MAYRDPARESAYHREYRQRNIERIRDNQRAARARLRAWRMACREAEAAGRPAPSRSQRPVKTPEQRHRDHVAWIMRWRAAHPEKVLEYARRNWHKHRKTHAARRKARLHVERADREVPIKPAKQPRKRAPKKQPMKPALKPAPQPTPFTISPVEAARLRRRIEADRAARQPLPAMATRGGL